MNYPDTATFIKTASSGYQGVRTIVSQSDIPCLFVENTGLEKVEFAEDKNTTALCYPDPYNPFILARMDSLEGVYLIFASQWYKIASYSINRDHLLTNRVDNIELKLERATPVAQIS